MKTYNIETNIPQSHLPNEPSFLSVNTETNKQGVITKYIYTMRTFTPEVEAAMEAEASEATKDADATKAAKKSKE